MNTDPARGWTGQELAAHLKVKPRNLLTQLAEWTRAGFLTRQLVYAGTAGGRKGVPESIRTHPMVFATLTAPGFGPVHGTRKIRSGARGRCRPPCGRPEVCPHGRPVWCTKVHGDSDPRLGEPLCGDCYDYPGRVAFNWWAPELWRRFTITLRRVLARRAGLTPGELNQRCRLSFVKVTEFQRRAVVHFHALIRLDGINDFSRPSPALTGDELAIAVREASQLVRLVVRVPSTVPVAPDRQGGVADEQDAGTDQARPRVDRLRSQPHDHEQDRTRDADEVIPPRPVRRLGVPLREHVADLPTTSAVLIFGRQFNVQIISGGADDELTPERVAAYLAKYATKSAEDFGLGDRRQTGAALAGYGLSEHVARVVRTCWEMGGDGAYAGLRRWVHMAGFRGHFASKSRRYSTTLGAIRRERRDYRRREASERARLLGQADPYDDEDTTLVVAEWRFAGPGYLTAGDAALALSAAARARERRDAARDHIGQAEGWSATWWSGCC